MSRNLEIYFHRNLVHVTSREGRVSRNLEIQQVLPADLRHVPRGACE